MIGPELSGTLNEALWQFHMVPTARNSFFLLTYKQCVVLFRSQVSTWLHLMPFLQRRTLTLSSTNKFLIRPSPVSTVWLSPYWHPDAQYLHWNPLHTTIGIVIACCCFFWNCHFVYLWDIVVLVMAPIARNTTTRNTYEVGLTFLRFWHILDVCLCWRQNKEAFISLVGELFHLQSCGVTVQYHKWHGTRHPIAWRSTLQCLGLWS